MINEVKPAPGSGKQIICMCAGGCTSSGSQAVAVAGLNDKVTVKPVGCQGFCEQGPIVTLEPQKVFYTRVTEETVADIVKSLDGGPLAEDLLYTDPERGEKLSIFDKVPFYARQKKLVQLRYFRNEYEAHVFDKRCPARGMYEPVDLFFPTYECLSVCIIRKHHKSRANQPERRAIFSSLSARLSVLCSLVLAISMAWILIKVNSNSCGLFEYSS